MRRGLVRKLGYGILIFAATLYLLLSQLNSKDNKRREVLLRSKKNRVQVSHSYYRHRSKLSEISQVNSPKRISKTDEQQKPYSGEITRSEIGEAIDLSTKYLISKCMKNGKFVYQENMDPGALVGKEYNMLRHGGTIYSLTMSYNSLKNDSAIRDAVIRASKFLHSEIQSIASDENLKAVVSRRELELITASKAKLGGTGLGLLALVDVEKIAPGTTDRKILVAMGNFLHFMQRKNGGFDSFYLLSKGKWDKPVSLFYPGEAAYGLTMLYELHNEPRWLNVALRSLGYLARLRRNKKSIELDHWALLATDRVLRNYKSSDRMISERVVKRHALQVINSMMKNLEQTPLVHTSHRATCMEGMIAMRRIVPQGSMQRFDKIVEQSVKFLMDIQVKKGSYKGAIPASGDKNSPKSTELRIDHNQHAMSAMIEFMDTYL